MFNKKFKKQASITFQDQDTHESIKNRSESMNSQRAIIYDDEDNLESIRKYVKVEKQQIIQNKNEYLNEQNNDYLRELEEENRLNNYLAKKSLENISELNIIDLENDGIYDDQPKQIKQPYNIVILDETDNNLITDMDEKRMNMIGIAKQQKLFYEHNSDDEEFNRFERNIIKSNKVHIDHYQGDNYKAFKFNDTKQMNYCSFMDNFQQINLQQIIGNLKSMISQEIFKRDKLQNEVDRSIQAIQSSEILVKTWSEQNQELQIQLREFELANEYFQCFNDMIKQKIPYLLKQYDEFNEIHDEYYNLIEARLEEEELEFQELFFGLPNEIILNYAKDICLQMDDVEEEYLDIEKLNTFYFNIMFVSPEIEVLQPIFDYHVILRFIELYCENNDDIESDLFIGLIKDEQLLAQLIMKCRFIKGLLTINPIPLRFIQQFFKCVLKNTYQYYKKINNEQQQYQQEMQNSLNFIKQLLEQMIKSTYKKKSIYSEQIIELLQYMKDILPKDQLDKLIKQIQ